MLKKPASIYINWAAYDELSDTVELTEMLAMRQLDELLRLRELGVRFDAYIMDCFWFATDGGFRTWRKPHWPDGPDRWLNRCLEKGILPGLWFPVNTNVHTIPERRLQPMPEWLDSVEKISEESWSACLFYGGYLAYLIESLHFWYERGVRYFKFDFANFNAAPRHLKEVMLLSEIRTANIIAFHGALQSFKKSHPEAVILAYNGFDDPQIQANTAISQRKAVDLRWLEAFDAIYCGDPRPADVPAMNFWRSKDVYSDHMTRYYANGNLPLHRIDNSAFMVGLTGTCYYRGTAAWKGMLLLSLARGGWANTYYGNLELLTEEKASWFAKAQSIFYPLQAEASFSTFGDMPGTGRPYGFLAPSKHGGLVTVVNPSQEVLDIQLPIQGKSRLLFRDAGFEPSFNKECITLGPEQLALVGIGEYSEAEFDLGIQEDVVIPNSIRKLDAIFEFDHKKTVTASIDYAAHQHLRVVFKQIDPNGAVKRSSGGAPPSGIKMGEILRIEVTQAGEKIPIILNYDKAIWSGLSWAVAEIAPASYNPQLPLSFSCTSSEADSIRLTGDIYEVSYSVQQNEAI